MLDRSQHILLLEPYYGGSHKAFLTGIQRQLDCCYTLVSLPARKWKMRMQLAAPWFAEQILELVKQGRYFDDMLTSPFLDVAVLRTFLARQGVDLPLVMYFHENQSSYPGQIHDPGIFQFTSINFTSALCADRVSYKELFPQQYRYTEGKLAEYLKGLLTRPLSFTATEAKQLTEKYNWSVIGKKYRKWLDFNNKKK